MNLLLLTQRDLRADGIVRLTGRRARHLVRVLRVQPGDDVRAGMLGGCLGRARVLSIVEGAVEVALELDREPPPPAPMTLLLALPRPKSLRRALHAAVTMGIKGIVLMNTWRVEKSYWQSPVLEEKALRELSCLALEQAGDTVLPKISLEKRFRPFVEDRLPALAAGSVALVAHPVAATACPHAVSDPVTLAIGPEGGFIPFEIDLLAAAGFKAVHFGPRILRVEQAVAALLGRLL